MFRNRRSRERMVKYLGILIAISMLLALTLPFLTSR
jgi:hypothetical protein